MSGNRESLSDLQELLFRVRSPKTRQLVEDAIEAYYGRAYRASIMSIWVAVSFDLLEKIEELATYGDKEAKKYTKALKGKIESRNIQSLSQIEQELLKVACDDFELISKEQKTLFERLKEDRNSCAHPVYTSDGQIFTISSEQARMYLTYAISNLLCLGPVRGRSSVESITNDIKGEAFPHEPENAGQFLEEKYLKYSKAILLENLLEILLKAVTKDDEFWSGFQNNALRAILGLSHTKTKKHEQWMKDNLSKFCDSLESEELSNMVSLIIHDSRYWEWIGNQHRLQLITLIKKISITPKTYETPTLATALLGGVERYARHKIANKFGLKDFDEIFHLIYIKELQPILIEKLQELPEIEQTKIINKHPHKGFSIIAVNLYSNAGSFRTAEHLGQNVILPMVNYFDIKYVNSVLHAAVNNSQIYCANGSSNILYIFVNTLLERSDIDFSSDIDWKSYQKGINLYYDDINNLLLERGLITELKQEKTNS